MDFAVIGAGAWGTAFALHLNRRGLPVTLVTRRAEHSEMLNARRENPDYLPGVTLPDELVLTADLKAALAKAEVALLAVPSQSMRAWSARIAAAVEGARRLQLLVSLSKGLE